MCWLGSRWLMRNLVERALELIIHCILVSVMAVVGRLQVGIPLQSGVQSNRPPAWCRHGFGGSPLPAG